MAKGKSVLTTGDVAKMCNVAPRTVSKWFDSGQLKGYRIPGSKDRRIPFEELLSFMRVHNMPISGLPSGKTRVLIVDSNETACQALVKLLHTDTDYEVQSVHTSFETGVTVQKFSPHIIVLNLFASGIDASAICDSVRSDRDMQAIKIIAIAGQLSEGECLALQQKGFDDYIIDTKNAEEIIRKIEQATAIVY
jgi:excisionase family DNA binding protein